VARRPKNTSHADALATEDVRETRSLGVKIREILDLTSVVAIIRRHKVGNADAVVVAIQS